MKISKYTTRLSVSDKSWLLYNAVTDRFVLYSKELDFGKQTDLDVLKRNRNSFMSSWKKEASLFLMIRTRRRRS